MSRYLGVEGAGVNIDLIEGWLPTGVSGHDETVVLLRSGNRVVLKLEPTEFEERLRAVLSANWGNGDE